MIYLFSTEICLFGLKVERRFRTSYKQLTFALLTTAIARNGTKMQAGGRLSIVSLLVPVTRREVETLVR